MKKYRLTYRDSYFDDEQKFIVIFAETSQDAENFFFDNYTGVIFRTGFIGYA